jgi:pSer/pThr/pTyr-binding forkhead associated (FHA) protein
MITFIEFVEGPDAGVRLRVAPNLTLGRSKADIIIRDPKISGTHAQVQSDARGQLLLIDLDSANGLYINGLRVKKIAFLQGVIFSIGRTQFRVVQVEGAEAVIPKSDNDGWYSALRNSLIDAECSDQATSNKISSFTPAIKLTFIEGIQAESEIILGYGPRKLGSDSLDIEILDKDAPKEAFELHPKKGAAEFRNKALDRVSINKQPISIKTLQEGDLISFGSTLIKISYL